MGQRRPWLQEQDKLIYRFIAQNQEKNDASKMKWNDIAESINQTVKGSVRTGKQCRERWHNQLDPNVKHNQQWSDRQINDLLNQQKKFGNKWSQIAKKLPGRTDNNVKNFFYSTLRRGVRRINGYITYLRKKKIFKKEFSQTVLSKILAVADGKYAKLEVKHVEYAIQLAKKIRDRLIRLAHQQRQQTSQCDQNHSDTKEQIIQDIVEFNKNCKKRKSKKRLEQGQSEQEEVKDQQQEFMQKVQSKKSFKTREMPQKKQKAITKSIQIKEPRQKRLKYQNFSSNTLIQELAKDQKHYSSVKASNSFNRLSQSINQSSSFKKFVGQQHKTASKTKKIHKVQRQIAKGRQKKEQKYQNNISKAIQRKQSVGPLFQSNKRYSRMQTINGNQSISFSKLIAQAKNQLQKKVDQSQSFIRKVPVTRRNSLLNNQIQNIDIPFSATPKFTDMLQSMDFGPQLNRRESFGVQKSMDFFGLGKSGQIDFPHIVIKRDDSLLGLQSSLNFEDKKQQKRELRKRQSFLLKSNDSFGK